MGACRDFTVKDENFPKIVKCFIQHCLEQEAMDEGSHMTGRKCAVSSLSMGFR